MQVIEHIEVGAGGAATITFSSIPADYTDLYVVFSGRTNKADNIGYGQMYVNGDAANWTERTLQGNGGGVASSSDSTPIEAFVSGGNTTANTFGVYSCYIPNYTSSNAKSMYVDLVSENNASGAFSAMQRITAALWNDTDAITSITFDADASDLYVQYSSATLYGITAGSDGTTVVS